MACKEHAGRFNFPPPCNNAEPWVPGQFEAAEDDAGRVILADPGLLGDLPAGGNLKLVNINMEQADNRQLHQTQRYKTTNQTLVLRRAATFQISLQFNRPVNRARDKFKLIFVCGPNPTETKRTMVSIMFPRPDETSADPREWTAEEVASTRGPQWFKVEVKAASNAIVGLYQTFVMTRVVTAGGSVMWARSDPDPEYNFFMLFNAWSKDDEVYMENGREREEYVLQQFGVIFMGDYRWPQGKPWSYAQFDQGVLEASLYLLDKARMAIHNRGKILDVVRIISAILNAQDDMGCLIGRWDGNYRHGVAPTFWSGSKRILQQYHATSGTPIRYAQCWVFAGVFTTVLRALGVPCRTITNFNSAHDSSGSLSIELIFKANGDYDSWATRDSVWNYHCWNEVFFSRPDLPPSMSGWQAVDATPQETSGGYFRCGPASISAIKDGIINHEFDSPFIYAEVNSNMVYLKRDHYGRLTRFKVDREHVGKLILTKAVGSSRSHDITLTYKYRQDSDEDRRSMATAESYGARGGLVQDMPPVVVDAEVSALGVAHLGKNFILAIDFHNKGLPNEAPRQRQITARLSGSVVFYTGAAVSKTNFMDESITVTVGPDQTKRVEVTVYAEAYEPHLQTEHTLTFDLFGTSGDGHNVANIDNKVILAPPTISITVTGERVVGGEMYLRMDFTNPLSRPLSDVVVSMDGPGLDKIKPYRLPIEPNSSISWTESFVPDSAGQHHYSATLDCPSLHHVAGFVEVTVGNAE